jgi:hypothetical protein
MHRYTAIILTLVYALAQVTNVHADAIKEPRVTGSKVNTHIIQPKPEQTCHNWQANGWIVERKYYPIYSDYLSDFAWYFEQYPGTCKVAPEQE